MKNYNEEYYYMVPVGSCHPLLNTILSEDSIMLHEIHVLNENYLIRFRFGAPLPRKPELADVHNDAYQLIISNKIKEAMQAMQLKDVQYLPATIENPKTKEVFEDYWVLYIYNMIYCMNKEKSKFKAHNNGRIVSIDKLMLNNEVLDKIPLEERLVFALGEKRLQMLFHASIVERIVALMPKGMKFAAVAGWSDKKLFEAAYWEYILGKDD